ncbi:hypothetical protein BBD42_15925 [Paenibacillus sp. BIHB 4019]|uniref:Uncharacterized protein n=1 Tax=Paenibacillus sp. BIHB 4019 TaxID=1870819 RepID=A0A1B2DJA7_9BACL|nr:hypothetical protein [Paenibacillus sp. BIHB 4019]ANY67788.1 hypothetical protein BBD42_15925 [Paenibacillus sp. BIHB 4019]
MGYQQQAENDQKKENGQADELLEEELEEVVGGLATVSIPRCKLCHVRIAVYDMTVCAVCFRTTQVSHGGEDGQQ